MKMFPCLNKHINYKIITKLRTICFHLYIAIGRIAATWRHQNTVQDFKNDLLITLCPFLFYVTSYKVLIRC